MGRKYKPDEPEFKKYGMTKKQYDFANEYLRTNNVIESYQKVYDTKGSKSTVSSQAYALIKNEKIQRYLKEIKDAAIERNLEKRINMVNKIKQDEELNIMLAEELMAWWSSIILSESRSIKMSDRIKCSELLGKAHGIFSERIKADISANQDIVINISEDNENDEE